jgi:acyl dehydratase
MEEFSPQQQLGLAQRLYAGLQVGQEMGPWQTVFTEKDVRDYAASIDDENPWYLEKSLLGQSVAHPAMTAAFYVPLCQEAWLKVLGDAAQSLVAIHTKAEHRYTNHVPLGKRLTVRAKVAEKYIRRDRYYVVVELWTVDEEGRDIVRSRDTLLLTPVRISERQTK